MKKNSPHDREKVPVDKKVREEIRRLRELADHLRRRAFEAFLKKKPGREPPAGQRRDERAQRRREAGVDPMRTLC
jgi:hypothetical protein